MTKYRLRRGTVSEIPTLLEQRHSMFVGMHAPSGEAIAVHDRAFPAWARREMLAGRLICFLVEDNGNEVIGGGSLWLREVQPHAGFKGGKVPYLMSMYTDPRHRGKRVATMIVKEAIAWSRKRGYGAISLHASKMGRPLYARMGWKATSEMELDLGKKTEKKPEDA